MKKKKRIALFGMSCNPPGLHHRIIIDKLLKFFDEVVIVPCGPRPDKATTDDILPIHRAVMADLTFGNMRRVKVDLTDLEKSVFTRSHELYERYSKEGEVWLVVGTDLTKGGKNGRSPIQREWENGRELWRKARFAVAVRAGFKINEADLPPHCLIFEPPFHGSSTEIRQKVFNHQSIRGLVVPAVEGYIERYGLYRGMLPRETASILLPKPRLLVVVDEYNPAAVAIAKKLRHLADLKDPNLIVVIGGDGTMLHAIGEYWRLRLPFLGINVGHRGFLLNDIGKDFSSEIFWQRMTIHQAPLLYVETTGMDGKIKSGLAFNDAWVQVELGKTAWLEVIINGHICLPKLIADGALVSTAAGSTAYARAMGATPILIGTQALLLVGNNVSEPAGWKSAQIAIDSVIEIRTVDPTSRPKKRPIYGFVDSASCGEIERMLIRVSRIAAVELAFLPGHDLTKKLSEIQFSQR